MLFGWGPIGGQGDPRPCGGGRRSGPCRLGSGVRGQGRVRAEPGVRGGAVQVLADTVDEDDGDTVGEDEKGRNDNRW